MNNGQCKHHIHSSRSHHLLLLATHPNTFSQRATAVKHTIRKLRWIRIKWTMNGSSKENPSLLLHLAISPKSPPNIHKEDARMESRTIRVYSWIKIKSGVIERRELRSPEMMGTLTPRILVLCVDTIIPSSHRRGNQTMLFQNEWKPVGSQRAMSSVQRWCQSCLLGEQIMRRSKH